jgi:uncharacterized membrane protein HdeD (DUF308 family)
MEMSILGLQTAPEESQQVVDPFRRTLSASRMIALIALALCVFGISAICLLQTVPGPYNGLDYMVIGTVSVMAGLLAIFVVLMAGRRSVFR